MRQRIEVGQLGFVSLYHLLHGIQFGRNGSLLGYGLGNFYNVF